MSYIKIPPSRTTTIDVKPERFPNPKGLPVIPPLPPGQPEHDPNPAVAICGECGLEIRQVMAYCCMNSRCPVQPKVMC